MPSSTPGPCTPQGSGTACQSEERGCIVEEAELGSELAVWPQASCFTSLSLSLPVRTIGVSWCMILVKPYSA